MGGRNIAARRRIGARILALMLASTAFVRQAVSAPADIFTTPAPAIGAAAPKARDVKDGDASVATQTGALNYAYPIQVPPGRNGLAPQLALTYSSQASVHGTIAAGWSLPIPEIREDTSQGRLATRSPTVLVGDLKADDRFTSSLAGHARLIKVPIAPASDTYGVYLAHGDTSGKRYERLNPGAGAYWRVLGLDGSTMLFGEPARMNACTSISENYAPLTTVRDAFGNEVRYEYELGFPNECRLSRITWGYNPSAGLTQAFAKVEFTYVESPRCASGEASYTGAQLDYRTGTKIVTGASKLAEMRATAFPFGGEASPSHTRVVTLGYWDAEQPDPNRNTERCNAPHAPLRLLRSIQESAWGTEAPLVTLPAVTFDYGTPAVTLSASTAGSIPWPDVGATHGPRTGNLGWGRRPKPSALDHWPTIESMMLDIDGDGLPDRVTNSSKDTTEPGECRMTWTRNQGPPLGSPNAAPTFGGSTTTVLPRLRWHKDGGGAGAPFGNFGTPDFEHCALNGQVTSYRNVLVGSSVTCHDGSSCQHSSTPGLTNESFCYSQDEFGLQCPTGVNNENPYRTYLAYRWLDVTADGLPDLVAAVHGDIRAYDIVRGNDGSQTPLSPTESPFGVPWPACPAQFDRCKDVSQACLQAANNWPKIVECFDDANAPSKPCHQLATTVYSLPGAPSAPSMQREPYQRCEGLYPWVIYENQGGTFATTPVIKYSPVPLESASGDSNISGPSITSIDHTIADLDGDGILDAAQLKSGTQAWQVWRGDGTGGFESKRYTMITHTQAPQFFGIDSGTSGYGYAVQTAIGLGDLNGDGLSEHWDLISASSTNACWHNGTSYDLVDAGGGILQGTIDTAVKPGNDDDFDPTDWSGPPFQSRIEGGYTTALRRLADVDQDGRVDVVNLVNSPTVHFNAGGEFVTPSVGYPGNTVGVTRTVRASPPLEDGLLPWQLWSDLIDLDGDGLAESASTTGGLIRYYHATNAAPPRLLVSIDNGRGAQTTVAYASMHDKTTVEQNPNVEWFDGRPKASPNNQWVVKSLTVHDQFGGTQATTTQYYKNPRHGANDEGRYGFRGFEEVRTTTPTNAQKIERFDYAVDWSGRLVETRVHPTASSTPDTSEVHTIDRTQWRERTLFSGTHKAYHATVREHFTCSNGQTAATCTPAGAAAYTKTVLDQDAFNNDAGQSVVWVDTETMLQAGTALENGDRRTTSTFAFSSDTTQHRLRPLTTTREQRVGGAWTMFGKTAKTWDASLAELRTEEVWFDADDGHRAITRFQYDMTGNVIERWKPLQNEASSTRTVFDYDARKLFAITETNELGHVRNHVFEYGTGTKVITSGPNTSGCGGVCPPNAPPGSICLPAEQSEIKIDGFGRPLEEWITVSGDGCTYFYHQRATNSYVDTPTVPTTPSSFTERVRIDNNASTWTEKRTDIDGFGRPIQETVFVQGTAPADQVTTFTYSTEGWLTAVEVPDPTSNNAARVQYIYTYDSLSRPLSMRRPDATTLADRSGVVMAYDGMTTITTEIVGAAGGEAATTKVVSDRFGRISQVHELNTANPATFATTAYTYEPNDQVSTIVDAEGVTTILTHDFAGRRTEVTRGSRVWKYLYDKNSNLVSEQVPGSTGPADDINYTTSIAYDDLDRPLQKLIGQRALSGADQLAFGNAKEDYYYDLGGNMKGKLRYWFAYPPNSSTASVIMDVRATTQGQRFSTRHTLNIAGYPALTRGFYQDFYLFGGLRGTHYYDAVGAGTQATKAFYFYDARGLPSRIQLITGSTVNSNVAVQTRNVAGLVTKRRSTLVPGGTDWVESNWTYDKVGRVEDQVVQTGPTISQVARQTLTYFGNDDPSQLVHYLGTTPQTFNYTYDRRHQILTATSTTASYFAGAYNYGTAGRLASANESQTIDPLPQGSEVQPRNVNYVYGGIDPEQVTALTNVTGGGTYASFTYDLAGNMTAKCTGGEVGTCSGGGMEKLEYVYDGRDQLRRVTRRLAGLVTGSEEYWYDEAGTRVAIVKRDDIGAKTEMIWFIGDTQAHYDASGAVTHVYSHVSLGTPVTRVDRTADTSTTTEYQFHGLASSTLAAVAADGTVNASFIYTPFGSVAEATNAGGGSEGVPAHERRHNDKFFDTLSGLTYYGARFYDRTLLGWTSADPLYLRAPDAGQMSSPRRASVYTFSLQNPLRYVDPDGLDPAAAGSLGSLSSYKSEMEISTHHRATLEADTNWELRFRQSVPTYQVGCMGPLGVLCTAVFDKEDAEKYLRDKNVSKDTSELLLNSLSERHWATDVALAVAFAVTASLVVEYTIAAPSASVASSVTSAGPLLQRLENSGFQPTQTAARIDPGKVSEYAKAMANGSWVWSQTDKIIVDAQGAILSGHHRIIAAFQAAVEIPADAMIRMTTTNRIRPIYEWANIITGNLRNR